MTFPQITVAGKKYPISFKTSTLARLYREKGIPLDEITNGLAGMDMIDMYNVIRLAIIDAYERQGKQELPPVTWMNIADWQDEKPEEFKSTMAIIGEAYGVSIEPEEEKKRSSARSKK